ncbi:MAG: hypothetical protein ACE15C_08230 [Phycisphaerae bacterium]
MAERRLGVILTAVIGGLFIAGCECNRAQWPGIYDNVTGADWRNTMQDCATECDTAFAAWPQNAIDSLSGLEGNLNGTDWRRTMIDCRQRCIADSYGWQERIKDSLSGLESNLSGDDWRRNVAGSCCDEDKADPPGQTRKK